MISEIYNQILYIPLLNALIYIYNTISLESLGFAVIILTIIIRIILFPLFHKMTKNQMVLQKIQPLIKATTEKHKDNKEEQVKKILEIYKTNKVNPFSSIGFLLIQIPILLALFHVFVKGFTDETLVNLYSFIYKPDQIHSIFLNLINLEKMSIIIVVLAAFSQYMQGQLSLLKNDVNKNDPAQKIGRQMIYIAPALTFFILLGLPSVIGLYWITTSVFSIGQQIIINHSLKNYGKDQANN
ncbi:MAG: hypothetical protein COV57_01420 [Candidatus Liptonbacteria bacterium CG11_big_fil_rev_8_21_14_0_20_35_14]|uniref:Membrane insertase YidC/Oxa/ALB C-terminal domain-containing protein n=1 Tax=Candidatus Liptonbacteria bacterium CG11_big_fil_rev_8_21_14_0_20_35_14 TaxID=1974634 RepID=A0A2H0NA70_9BACT|nr:MAG: hypothetical protein COV57_01420 [Candidatus Liptonbacteria bacterium CG11_big_fil_rev_8_21_14_0_20_35_14]